ncbi:hypothetical protein DVA81_19705, partial [Acinetobacter baumannii]
DELLTAFEEMHTAYKAVVQTNAQNKKRLSHTINELVKVKSENQNLTQERDELKNQVQRLVPTNTALSNQVSDLIEKLKS